jgi:putative transposase
VPAPKKRRREPSHRALARRVDDQDPRRRRRARQPRGALVDAWTVGRHHRSPAALERLDPEALIADKGYDADAFVERLESRNVTPVIPPKTNRKQPRKTDFALYRERNLVERFFCTLKKFRAIATRYDKLASTFLAGVLLVCVIIWLN